MRQIKPTATCAFSYGVLGLATALLYWQVHRFDFIWLDDSDYVTENPFVQAGLQTSSLLWAFTHTFASNWHPLTWISHMADCQWFGLSPTGPHLVNAALHVTNTLLLFGLLRQLTKSLWRASVVAALFAWHPVHVESVAWVAERKDVLSTFFGFLALRAYAAYVQQRRATSPGEISIPLRPRQPWTRRYWTAWVWLALGLMCKPMLVTWPFLMLLLDFWPLQRVKGITLARPFSPGIGIRFAVEKIPFVLLVLASCIMTLHAQDEWHSVASSSQFPWDRRIANSCISYVAYLGKLFWPTRLAVFYPMPQSARWELASYCALALIPITALVWHQRAHRPHLLTGWFWFIGSLVPVIGLVQVGGQAMADRYTYVPSVGLFVAVVWALSDFVKQREMLRRSMAVFAGGLLCLLWAICHNQIGVWRDNRSLFTHAREVTEDNFIAYDILAELLQREGRLEEAIGYFKKAVELQPAYAAAWSGLGLALATKGETRAGIEAQHRALEISPENPQTLDNLGLLLLRENRASEAEQAFRHAATARPGFAQAQAHLGTALQNQRRWAEAAEAFQQAVRFKPAAINFRVQLAQALLKAKRVEDGLAEFRQILNLAPQNEAVRLAYAEALSQCGQAAAAESEFQRILATSPTNAFALDGMGFVLAGQQKPTDALRYFNQACALVPTNGFFKLHRAMLYTGQGEPARAIREYWEAVRLDSKLTAALNNLAWLLATQPDPALRDGTAAVRLAGQACALTENLEPVFVGTLAAAYAEEGNFEAAITNANRALSLAREFGLTELVRRNSELLAGYQAGKPHREPAGQAPP